MPVGCASQFNTNVSSKEPWREPLEALPTLLPLQLTQLSAKIFGFLPCTTLKIFPVLALCRPGCPTTCAGPCNVLKAQNAFWMRDHELFYDTVGTNHFDLFCGRHCITLRTLNSRGCYMKDLLARQPRSIVYLVDRRILVAFSRPCERGRSGSANGNAIQQARPQGRTNCVCQTTRA